MFHEKSVEWEPRWHMLTDGTDGRGEAPNSARLGAYVKSPPSHPPHPIPPPKTGRSSSSGRQSGRSSVDVTHRKFCWFPCVYLSGMFRNQALERLCFLQRRFHSPLVDISKHTQTPRLLSYRSIDKALNVQMSHSSKASSHSFTQLQERVEFRIGFTRRVMRRLHRYTRASEKSLWRHGASLKLGTHV
jgi:hypothetical protein